MPLRLVECEHLGDALERLREEHEAGRWVYRGQTYRRRPHRVSAEGQDYELENLYPQSFRFAADYPAVSKEFLDRVDKEEAKANALFHAFNSFLISKYEAGRRSSSARFAWLDPYADELRRLYTGGAGPSFFSGFDEAGMGLSNPKLIRLSWSLAQHYGVVTALLDLTRDPDVAAWFATHLWDEPKLPEVLTGHGVIYRFDEGNLVAAVAFFNHWLLSQSRRSAYEPPPDKGFVQSLDDIPEEFGLRPRRQDAIVVSGFEALHFHSQFRIAGKLDAFLFPHLPDELQRWPSRHAREHLIPGDDPFLDLKAEFEDRWAPHAETTFGVRYTRPVVILTPGGPRYMNVPDEEADAGLTAARERLYDEGMALLASDMQQAEEKFEAVVSAGHGAQGRFSSLAHLRLALIRFTRDDAPGMVDSLERALDGAQRFPGRDWVGQLLQSILQGVLHLVKAGKGRRVLRLLERAIEVAREADQRGLALEAQLGAATLKGQVELMEGMVQAGLATLASVAKRPLDGLKPAERVHVAIAADLMAQAYEQLGDHTSHAAACKAIVEAFSKDQHPFIATVVGRARQKL